MELTDEQKAIVEAEGDICVDAVAGSGKTSSALAYVKARPDKRFLYTCFNRSVRNWAEEKFPENVFIKNSHSLAYAETNARQWEIAKSFDVFDVIDILKIKKKRGFKNYDAILGGHILKGLNLYFCLAEKNIKNFNYLLYSGGDFVDDNIEIIHDGIISIYEKMLNKKIPIVHDFYLKQFQISNPKLNYDYIIADEMQDSSPCIMDILGNQECNKLVLGDKFQSIYGFLKAENALQEFKNRGYETLKLTQSFRFRQDVADLAKQIISLKNHIRIDTSDFEITGIGSPNEMKTKAYLSRSNLKLVDKAADIVSSTHDLIHFEGNINSYMFANGVGLYDIFFLWNGDKSKVKNKFLSKFQDYKEYKEFLTEVGGGDQQILCSLIERYKGSIFSVIKEIKNRNVEKEEANIILSNTHKCKGGEYDEVEIADDFVRESQILKSKEKDFSQISEEINVLYTAITRTKNKIKFPLFYLNNFSKLKESRL